MVEKRIRSGICHYIYRCVKANNKYIKVYDKIKKSSHLKYWDVNDVHGCAMSKKLSINDFKWVEDISEFDESFGKRYNEESDKGYFLYTDVQYPEKFA